MVSPSLESAIEDPVDRSVGPIGRWQLWVTLATFLVKFPVAWHQLSIVFLAPPVDFHCIDNSTDRCSSDCPKHEFDTSIFTNTIIMEWDLVCGRAQLANWAQTIVMLGILFGSIIFGYLSDRFGRRGPFVGAIFLQLGSGVGAAFSSWFSLFLVMRFLSAVATGGTMVTSFVLLMEIVGGKWRTILGVLYQIPFNLGHFTLAGIAYLLRDWRHVQLTLSLPSIILLSYYWLVPESPRWLLAVGKADRATEVLEKGAKMNNRPTEHIKDLVQKATSKKNTDETAKGNIVDLFRTPRMRSKTLCICFNWIVCGLCFFGVAQYLGQAGGNIFINVAISALVQIPGNIFCWYLMNAVGRKKTQIIANVTAGLACLLIPLVPEHLAWPRVTLSAIGITGMGMSFTCIYIFSGEIFPTVVRNVGVGTASMCARFGSMAAPFVAGLNTVDTWLPPLIFGIIPLIGACWCLVLPETLNCVLPDTIEEGENFVPFIKSSDTNIKQGVVNRGADVQENHL